MSTELTSDRRRRKVCFLFIAQAHQVLHSLPIALALARGWPELDIEIAATSSAQLRYVADLTGRLGARQRTARFVHQSGAQRCFAQRDLV